MTKSNPFKETLNSKKELFDDFKIFAERKKELGQNALLAYYGFCHGEAIMKYCYGKVDDLMKHAGIPITSIAYFQAGFNAWKNLYDGLTVLPESNAYTTMKKPDNDFKGLLFQQIFYGAPGTGKSHKVKKQTGELLDSSEEKDLPNVFRTTFHPDTDYASFVGSYKPTMKPTSKEEKTLTGKDEEIVYEFVPQTFTDAYIYAYTHSTEQTYLVIEEINRGNCAQIFGDLFQLLDRKGGVSEYKIKADKDLANYLIDILGEDSEGIKEGKLCLPANLSILATMNTSDQSLFPMDSAFKRRWDWKYIPIKEHTDKNYKINIGEKTYDWWGFLERINKVIGDTTSSEDKKLGYFFVKTETAKVSDEQFVGKVLFYIWNDVFKNYGFDHTIFSKGEKDKFVFSDFFNAAGAPNKDNVQLFLKRLEDTIKIERPLDITPKEESTTASEDATVPESEA